MTPAVRTAIIRRFVETCEPLRLPGPLSGLDVRDVTAPADPAAAALALAAEFPEDALLTSGVLVRDGRVLALAPGLAAPGAVIIVFRDQFSGEPVALATDAGAVGGGLAVLAALEDAVFAAARSRGDHTVAFTADAASAAALRGVGMPAAPAADLADPNPDDVDPLSVSFGFRRTLSARRERERLDLEEERLDAEEERREAERRRREAEAIAGRDGGQDRAADGRDDGRDDGQAQADGEYDREYDGDPGHGAVPDRVAAPVVAAWSPAALDPAAPAALAPLLDGIDRAAGLLRFKFDARVWSPTAASVERVAYHLRHRDRGGAVEAIDDSLFEDVTPWHRFRKAAERSDPGDLAAAAAALARSDVPASSSGVALAGRGSPGRELTRLVEQHVAGPLRRASARAPLAQRVLLLGLADAVETNSALGAIVRGSLGQALARGASVDPAAVAELAQFNQGVDRILSILKELRRCAGNRLNPVDFTAPPRSALPPPSSG